MPARLALPLAAAAASSSLGLAAAANSSQPLPSASRVCVENKGGFDLSFELWDTANNMLSSRSNMFSSSEQSCLELSSALGGVEPGNPVVAVVHARTGISHSLPPVIYSKANATVSFGCRGATKDFSCTLNGEEHVEQPGYIVAPSSESQQLRVKDVCVMNNGDFRIRARLWDTATGILGNWSDWFDMWAGGHGSSACLGGGNITGVASGHPLVLVISPDGTFPAVFRSVLYDPSAADVAEWVCEGSDARYDCFLEGASSRRLMQQPVLV